MKSSNRWGCFALVYVAVALLTSCGGGGGGGGSGPPAGGSNGGGGGGGGGGSGSGSLNFTADRSSLVFEYMEGNPLPPALDVVVTATGTYSGNLFLGATATGTGLSSTIPLTINSERQGTFLVSAAGGLAVGEYSGTLRLLACSDQACANQVGNSPLTLTYVTRVHPRLRVSSNQVALTSQSNAGTMQDVAVTLPWQATDFTTNVETGSEFLTVSQPNATTLRLNARAWPSGQHTASVRVNSGGQAELVSVVYTVTPPAGGEFNLRSDPTNLTLSAIERTSTTPTMLTVLGPTWEPELATETFVGYTSQSAGAQWLQVDPVAGGYRLTASAAQVNAGTYTANLVVRATQNSAVPSTQIEIPISFTVGEGLAQPADRDVTLDANTTLQSEDLSGSVPIALVAGPAVNWTAQTDRNWLTLTRGSGATGTSLEYVINPAMLGLENTYGPGDDVATIQITTTPFLTPRYFKVNLHQRLAHLRGIAPYYQVQGRPSRHVIRGNGFIANRDWSQHLLVMGQPAGAGRVTRVNDTELLVDVDAGQVVIDVRNELSAVPGWDPIQVIPSDTNSYQALTTGFDLQKLHYDAQRQRLLVIRRRPNDLDEIIAYPKTGPDTWQQGQATLIPGLRDFMVANDNRTVWFVTSNGLRFAPSDTLLLSPSTDQSFAPLHVPDSKSAMVMTNDWRVWFGSGNDLGRGTGVWYRDILSGNGLNVPLVSDLIQPIEGPWFTVSGNGERVYISQASSITPAPPLLALDAKDGVLFAASQPGDSSYLRSDAAINMDGSRLIGSGNEVRDLSYANIGSVEPNHQNFFAIGGAMNPEGTRAYMLAYDDTDFPNATPQVLPRVYVFDISTPVGAGQRMPLLGYFTVADYPTCRTFSVCLLPFMTLAPDGNTLFIAGSERLLVVPLPAENTLAAANKIRPAADGTIVTKPWRVNTRPGS